MSTSKYEVVSQAFVGGLHREAGDVIEMTAREAKYLKMAGVVREQKPTRAAPATAKAAKKED